MMKALLTQDGKLNAKTVTSLALLGVVLVQEVAKLFGWHLTGDPKQVMEIVNTILTILGTLGLASNSADVKDDEIKAKIEGKE
ncbi:hypothetical protein FC40_GL000238 [Ligilactobacillus hayakitensis DSM 18933 = JCM 14209]|uniref:Holin n=1 Tax=Ligilactobacillus hayakitensis DSM 18933 = JCM 14209 TaxID=1423755 RepID=A0A0R1WSC2_9LACO|nr:hypothetical protein [Ligilactobacillus hayakitensis]KRM20317.1 hypothetical protein FC40_GL000238 [Ligilactobacillus hayakitensis DSM 18933 = JCM 14209]